MRAFLSHAAHEKQNYSPPLYTWYGQYAQNRLGHLLTVYFGASEHKTC